MAAAIHLIDEKENKTFCGKIKVPTKNTTKFMIESTCHECGDEWFRRTKEN